MVVSQACLHMSCYKIILKNHTEDWFDVFANWTIYTRILVEFEKKTLLFVRKRFGDSWYTVKKFLWHCKKYQDSSEISLNHIYWDIIRLIREKNGYLGIVTGYVFLGNGVLLGTFIEIFDRTVVFYIENTGCKKIRWSINRAFVVRILIIFLWVVYSTLSCNSSYFSKSFKRRNVDFYSCGLNVSANNCSTFFNFRC